MNNNKFFLTKRQLLITKFIIEKGKFATHEIINEIGISKSSFYYEMNALRDFFRENNIEILNDNKHQYSIKADKESINRVLHKIEKKDNIELIADSKERSNYIIFLLLCLSEPIMIKDVESKFNISKPTAIKSFQCAKEYLENEHLTVYSRPNYGSYVSGNEAFIRSAFVNLIIEDYTNAALKLLITISSNKQSVEKTKKTSVERLILDFLTEELLLKCIKMLKKYEEKENVRFGDIAMLHTVFLFAFSIKRIQANKYVEMQNETGNSIKNYSGYNNMKECIEYFENLTCTKIPENEQIYLMISLMEGKSVKPEAMCQMSMNSQLCEKATNSIIQEAAVYLGPELLRDEALHRNLFNHLIAVMYRNKIKIKQKNVLLDKIKNSYPYTFFVANRCAKNIEQFTGSEMSEDEAGYLTIYLELSKKNFGKKNKEINVIVVCLEGVVASWLIAANITKQYPMINVVSVLSVHDFENLKETKNIDLLITTTSELDTKNIPYVVVSPIMLEEDMRKIGVFVSEKLYAKDLNYTQSNKNGLLTFLDNEHIEVRRVASDWKEAVDISTKKLLEEGIINIEYIQTIKYNIIKYGPYVVSMPGIAVLHASANTPGIKLGVSLTTLAVPIYFDEKNKEPVSIIFTLSSPDTNSHLQILEDLVELYGSKSFITKVVNAKTPSEVRSIILSILNKD